MKFVLRQIFSGVLIGITETKVYSTPSTLEFIGAALNDLPNYEPVLTDADRENALRRVRDQMKVTADREIRAALLGLRGALAKAD